MEAPAPAADAAWASVEVGTAPDKAHELLADPVLLLRLNPCLDFERIEHGPDGRLHLAARNESNGGRIETGAAVIRNGAPGEITLRYGDGIKRETRILVEPCAAGVRLSITETYAAPNAEAEPDPAQVDRSLVHWTAAIRRHLEREARFGQVPGYRWLSRRFWPSMSPGQRRVAWLLVWTTAVEFLVFLAVIAVYLAAAR